MLLLVVIFFGGAGDIRGTWRHWREGVELDPNDLMKCKCDVESFERCAMPKYYELKEIQQRRSGINVRTRPIQ